MMSNPPEMITKQKNCRNLEFVFHIGEFSGCLVNDIFYSIWATDLLPNEIDFEKRFTPWKEPKYASFGGSITQGWQSKIGFYKLRIGRGAGGRSSHPAGPGSNHGVSIIFRILGRNLKWLS